MSGHGRGECIFNITGSGKKDSRTDAGIKTLNQYVL